MTATPFSHVGGLHKTAREVVSKGILAADESSGTIKKRFDSINLTSTEEARRGYRELLFTAPGFADTISGVILYDETIRQSAADGTPFPKLLAEAGVVPGIKVDLGAKDLAGCPGEFVSEGLDGLRERLAEYRELGARFAKWRALIEIGPGLPSYTCIEVNAHALARYAALCQEAGIVPIVEPEVDMAGDHTIERCEEVTTLTLQRTYDALFVQRVELEGTILKPNMVLPGAKCAQQASVDAVADATLRVLRAHVPPAVPGIAFLSGGQSDEAATAHLDAMNRRGPNPWELTYSYGRALQAAALKAWKGETSNIEAGQKAFAHRARLNYAARNGEYTADMEALAG